MPVAKCVRRCWDSQLTRRYWPGDRDEIAVDHPLVKAGCFQFLNPVDQSGVSVSDGKTQPLPELKNPEHKQRGNPNWRKQT